MKNKTLDMIADITTILFVIVGLFILILATESTWRPATNQDNGKFYSVSLENAELNDYFADYKTYQFEDTGDMNVNTNYCQKLCVKRETYQPQYVCGYEPVDCINGICFCNTY